MLRIQRKNREAHRVSLVLQGHLAAEWAELLERECLESSRSGLSVSLDLAGVVFVSLSGLEVLGRLARSGVGIIACPPLIADMLEQDGIEVERELPEGSDI